MKSHRNIQCLIFTFIIGFQSLQGQVLRDTADINLLKRGVDYIYNLQFEKADEIYRHISHEFPESPIPYLFKGLIIYWEYYPLLPDSPERNSFEDNMHKSIEICEKKSDKDADYAEYLLTDLCDRGMLLMFYADNGLSMNVFSLATSTYHYIRLSFEHTSEYNDFYFFTGLYNYYREEYPDAHPVYRPLAILFPKGNKVRGLKEMQIAAKNSIFLKADSYSYLSYIYIGYENDYEKSLSYNKTLYNMYPDNILFRTEYIKNLLLLKKYSEAENIIKSWDQTSSNKYFTAQMLFFNGLLQEKVYNNPSEAESFYNKAIEYLQDFGEYGNEYEAYAYFGLSRLSKMSGINSDKGDRKKYRKKAVSLASFRKLTFDN
jgi:tetratricopeptide (TPR) repeat protein